MMDFEIRHYQVVANTPALPLLVKGWAELLAVGHAGDGVLVCWDHKAIVAFSADLPVGVMSWSDVEWQNQLYVHLAYVEPGFRRRGVHRLMFRALVEKARELKRPVIGGGYVIGNSGSSAVMEAEDRRRHGVTTRFIVGVVADGQS
jgi:GNAT superfamily N-acetyltransferase